VAEAKYEERTTLQSSIDTSATTAYTLARETIFATMDKASETGAAMLNASEKIIMASQQFIKDQSKQQQQPIFINGVSSHTAESKDALEELKILKKQNEELVKIAKEEKEKADIDRAKLVQAEAERQERIKTEEEAKKKKAEKEARVKALQQELEELTK
jgi:hypothetical protein